MSLEMIEDAARERGLKGKAYQELQGVLDQVAQEERSYLLWHRLFIFTASVSLWVMMFASVLYLLQLDYEISIPDGLGTFLAVVLMVCFWIFLVSMFKSQGASRELCALEARAFAIIETS